MILHVSPGLCSCHTNDVAAVSQSEPHDFSLVSRLSLVSLVFLSPSSSCLQYTLLLWPRDCTLVSHLSPSSPVLWLASPLVSPCLQYTLGALAACFCTCLPLVSPCLQYTLGALAACFCACLPLGPLGRVRCFLCLLWIHLAGCFYHLSPLVSHFFGLLWITLGRLLVFLLLCSRLDEFTLLSLLVSLLASLVSTCLGLLWIRFYTCLRLPLRLLPA